MLDQLNIYLIDRFDYDESLEALDELVGMLRVTRAVLAAKMAGRSREVVLHDETVWVAEE